MKNQDYSAPGVNTLGAIFSLVLILIIFNVQPSYSSALITCDFRFLETFDGAFTYGTDWELGITIDESIDFTTANFAPLPEFFLDENYEKARIHEFVLMAYANVQFKIDLLVHNPLFMAQYYVFANSTSVKIVQPNRAVYGTTDFFFTMINQDIEPALPMNPLPFTKGLHPKYLLELGSITKDGLKKHARVNNVNYFKPEDLYWADYTYAAMPYLPFFSNCEKFDSYIPLLALFEQNEQCTLVDPEDTIPIGPFSFGLNPTSDTCSNVILNCIYDEDLTEIVEKARWFDSGPLSLFYITADPQPASSMTDIGYNSNLDNVNLMSLYNFSLFWQPWKEAMLRINFRQQ